MFSEGERYWTVHFENLTEDAVNNNPYRLIISGFWYDTDEDQSMLKLGLLFKNENDAVEKAKQIYYKLMWEKLSHSWDEEHVWCPVLDYGKIQIVNDMPYCERYFTSEKEALSALEEIGYVNFVKYVWQLRNITIDIPCYID